MATDFGYNNKTIVAGGPIKPNGKDMPIDSRTRVETYADISTIPVPYVGMKITVKADETNNNKMTDYIVKSLKASSIGAANSLIDEVVRYVDYLGINEQSVDTNNFATKEELGLKADKTELHSHTNKTVLDGITSVNVNNWNNKVDKVEGKTLTTNDYTNEEKQTVASLKATVGDTSSGLVKDVKDLKTNGVSQDNINTAIEKYLQDHPVQSGATTEQAAQIEANKTAIGDENSGLIKKVNDIKNTELQNLNTAILRVNETVGNKSELPVGDENIIASINRIDGKTTTGNGLTSEQAQQLQTAYTHSQTPHVQSSDIPSLNGYATETFVTSKIAEAQLGGSGGGIDTSTFQLKTDETLETTDKTVVGAINELNNDLGGKSFVYLTQSEFDALESKNENVVYGITDGAEATSPSIDDVVAEINKLSLNISGSTLSLKYNGATLSTITLPASSGGGTETPETFGNIVLSKTTDSMTEGNRTTFTVKLDAAPTNSQVVSLSADNLYVMLDTDSLTFTAANYSTPQTVTVNAMSVDSTQTSTITVSSPNVSSKTLVITVNNSSSGGSSGGSDGLTRDGLVYYLDFKDQNYTVGSKSEYKTISDTNTLYSDELILVNMNDTNNNYEGNVIEGNILKNGELPSKRYPKIKAINTVATDIFTNKSFTLETYAQFNAKPVDNSTVVFNSGTVFVRGNTGKDIGLYITTENNGSYGYFYFDSTSIDYTQPHLYTVTIDQSVSGSITYTMYVDGQSFKTETKKGTIKAVNNPYLHILDDNDRNKEYASFRVYSKVLTAEEVLANYQYEQTIERTW